MSTLFCDYLVRFVIVHYLYRLSVVRSSLLNCRLADLDRMGLITSLDDRLTDC